MEYFVLALGTLLIGCFLGGLVVNFAKKTEPKNPIIKSLRTAIEDNQRHYKSVTARLRAQIRDYEQPYDLQKFANKFQGEDQDDLVSLFINELGGIRSLPRWVRPFIPAIQSYAKENPDKIAALVSRFVGDPGKVKEFPNLNEGSDFL